MQITRVTNYYNFRTYAAALAWMLEHKHKYHMRVVPPKQIGWSVSVEFWLRAQS